MSNRAEVEAVVLKFIEALKIDDASIVPLSSDVEYHTLFSPDPVQGEPDVRDHIEQVAPFMVNETYGKMIIDGGSVAMTTSVQSVNGIKSEGVFLFEVVDGRITYIRAVFDTRRLYSGERE